RESVRDAPFVAAFLDAVAESDDTFVAASGELRFHFDAKRRAPSLELRLEAGAIFLGQCILGHGGNHRSGAHYHIFKAARDPIPGLEIELPGYRSGMRRADR